MKKVIQALLFVVLAVHAGTLTSEPPKRSFVHEYPFEQPATDSLDKMLDQFGGNLDFNFDFSEGRDSLDDLFDQVAGAKKCDQEEYDPDSLDDLLNSYSLKRCCESDIKSLEKVCEKLISRRKKLSAKRRTFELNELNDYSLEIDDLSTLINNLSNSIERVQETIKELKLIFAR